MSTDHHPALWGQFERPWIAARPAMDQATRITLMKRLRTLLRPEEVVDDPAELLAYSYDATGERHWPDVVVRPKSADALGPVLAIAADAGLPVIPRGAGTNLSGGVLPLQGGMVVALSALDRVLWLDAERLRAAVEPGVVNADLQGLLRESGLLYAPDPASHRVSTIGGNVAENSGGPHCVKYGVTTNHVVRVAGHLVDGERVELWRSEVPGCLDWAGIVIGSEGTLMIVSEVELSLLALPAGTATILAAFPTASSAIRVVSPLVLGHNPSCVELLDQATVRLVEHFVHAGYPTEAGAVLLVEVEGSGARLQEAQDTVSTMLREGGALSVRTAASPEEAERLWLGRRSAYGTLARKSAHVWVQDVTVPRTDLAAMLDEVDAIGRRHGLEIITLAHAGDGNLHPNMAYNPNDAAEVARVKACDRAIMEACVARDGSITGEHGIGIDKLENLALMYGRDEQDIMMGLKRVFDPAGRLNPYKAILIPRGEAGPVPQAARIAAPDRESQVQEAARWARETSSHLVMRGAGLRSRWAAFPAPPDPRALWLDLKGLAGVAVLSRDNQTVDVWAGTPFHALDAALAEVDLEWGVDPWDGRETVGGMVSGALPPYRRTGVGPVRDTVLAVTVVDGQGRLMRFGRPTLKNVAGYDIPKLLVGSWGRLGALTRVTLRLTSRRELVWSRQALPWPEQRREARRLLASPLRPEAVIMTPTGLVTARRSGQGEVHDPAGSEAMADPRPAWGQVLRDSVVPPVWTAWPSGLPEDPRGDWWLAWPDAGIVAGPAVWPGERVTAGSPDAPARLLPTLERLRQGTQAVWDPHGIWGGVDASRAE